MAYSAPSTISTGDLITAAIWNQDVVANPIAIYAGAMSVTSQAVGDILYASSTTQLGRIAAVATGQVLTSAGTGTVPAWSSNLSLGGTLAVAGAVTFNDAGADVDFRVESDSATHMLFVDGGYNGVGIGMTPSSSILGVTRDATVDSPVVFQINRNVATIGKAWGLTFTGGTNTSAAAEANYGYIYAEMDDVTNGSVDGSLMFGTAKDQSTTTKMKIDANGNVGFGGLTDPDGVITLLCDRAGTPSIRWQNPDGDVDCSITAEGSSTAGEIWMSANEWINAAGNIVRFDTGQNTATINVKSAGTIQLRTGSGAVSSTRLTIDSSGAVSIGGSVSKGSGSFKIDHPLPALTDSKYLIHSFVEGPRADLIYRGSVILDAGTATIDLDEAAGMTSGTWILLCRDEQCYTTNETGWHHVRGSVSGSTLTIDCEEECDDTVSWMVVAERRDQHMYDTEWTDEEGRPIVEPDKPESPSE